MRQLASGDGSVQGGRGCIDAASEHPGSLSKLERLHLEECYPGIGVRKAITVPVASHGRGNHHIDERIRASQGSGSAVPAPAVAPHRVPAPPSCVRARRVRRPRAGWGRCHRRGSPLVDDSILGSAAHHAGWYDGRLPRRSASALLSPCPPGRRKPCATSSPASSSGVAGPAKTCCPSPSGASRTASDRPTQLDGMLSSSTCRVSRDAISRRRNLASPS